MMFILKKRWEGINRTMKKTRFKNNLTLTEIVNLKLTYLHLTPTGSLGSSLPWLTGFSQFA